MRAAGPLAAVMLLAVSAACSRVDNTVHVDAIRQAVARSPEWVDRTPLGKRLWAIERAFYENRGYMPAWTAPRISSAMHARQEQTVKLKQPLPVHIGYWTAWVQPDGSVRFLDDPYGIDAAHARVLASRTHPPARVQTAQRTS